MRPSFHPRLVNGPFDDPGLFVPLTFRKKALLFDLGDISPLAPGDILKISHVFVTHTHMDHFIGFDQLLRMMLGREKNLYLFGPRGFLKNLQGKLQAYTWNLVHNYDEGLTITATEIGHHGRTAQSFDCRKGFAPSPQVNAPAGLPIAMEDTEFTVYTDILDHQIPSLAFALKERFHVNILKPQLAKLGLEPGPWVNQFKTLLLEEADAGTEIQIPGSIPGAAAATFTIGDLAEKIARITRGQKIAYVADAAFTPENEKKIIELALEADHLFIEAAFLEKDSSVAKEKHHLTALQAGTLASKARVRDMSVFHHSPRYTDLGHLLQEEARLAFNRS
ncbi:MAG: MBL fold metallo-hydrolase [Desulfobacteraceae bacterium]|jgi:ribonuclease Z